MARNTTKTLNLPIPLVELLEEESDESGRSQSSIVAEELNSRYETEASA